MLCYVKDLQSRLDHDLFHCAKSFVRIAGAPAESCCSPVSAVATPLVCLCNVSPILLSVQARTQLQSHAHASRSLQVTHLFRDVLHGWGQILLSVNVSPCAKDYDETSHVLKVMLHPLGGCHSPQLSRVQLASCFGWGHMITDEATCSPVPWSSRNLLLTGLVHAQLSV